MSLPRLDETHAAARAAIDAGLAATDPVTAWRWFNRAHRLLPDDPSAFHLMVSTLSGIDPPRALALLEPFIAAAPRPREIHLCHLALLFRLGNIAAAAAALDRFLANFAIPRHPGFNALADQIARAAATQGWLGITGQGRVITNAPPLTLALDHSPACLKAIPRGEHQLPPAWRRAHLLHATTPLGRLLGGTISLSTIRQIHGFVAWNPTLGLHGWAVAPADPDTIPRLDVFAGAAKKPFATVAAADDTLPTDQPHARGFRLPPSALPAATSFRVRTQHGHDLAGSPIHLAANLPTAKRNPPPRRDIDIIIPLYRGAAHAEACVASLRAALPPNTRIVAIDDAIPEPALLAWAHRSAAAGDIILLRHPANRGFPAAINTGLRHAAGRDVVILNSDTLLPPGAIARLADAAYAAPDIGTATPMTNDGSITTIGVPGVPDPMPDAAALQAADTALRAANPALRIEIPTCVGFCTYIRYDCLADTGLLREDSFAQGYGEENDFSCRAAARGWRHVAACDVMVGHQGGVSFGAVRASLIERNLAILHRLHPGYATSIAEFTARDPLRPARAAYDAQRWAAARADAAIVLVTHDSGGGVERHVAARVAAMRSQAIRAIVVRPRRGFAVSDGTDPTHPNLVFTEVEALAEFLRADAPRVIELHHIAAHAPGIERLAGLLRVPFDIMVHDYAAICPRVTLSAAGRYCGEPAEPRDCDDCIADHGALIPFSGSVAAARASQAALFGGARRVIVASHDVARRLRRYMTAVAFSVQPWENEVQPAVVPRRPIGDRLHIVIVGAIGVEKGYDIILACARDAARRNLPLRFTVVGHTIDDRRLMQTGQVFVTGPFAEGEAADLLRDTAPDIGFLPSIWPETWCYALSALWQAGLHVLAFDLGTPAERIRARGGGTLLAPTMQAAAINDRMLQFRVGQEKAEEELLF